MKELIRSGEESRVPAPSMWLNNHRVGLAFARPKSDRVDMHERYIRTVMETSQRLPSKSLTDS